ncbi:MAG: ATP synthase F1 subunit delta [Lachnospiraceae bacterium]|nr:ATP synthase F1 subunit delta [Lachnospiraceae bacterium]MBR5732900.1 ATP synthase F1 subunit delta [Lachnospiraceae bacterium]
MTERAGVYGGSLYDLAAEEQLTEPIMKDLIEVRGIFRENQDYLRLLAEPSIKREERIGLIEKAFGTACERYFVSFLKLLCDRGMLGEYEGCVEAYKKRYNADHNIAEAVVTSAVALNDGQLKALSARLEEMSGKTIALTSKVDPKVLAGIKVELEGKQLDGTVMGRLAGMSKKLEEIII